LSDTKSAHEVCFSNTLPGAVGALPTSNAVFAVSVCVMCRTAVVEENRRREIHASVGAWDELRWGHWDGMVPGICGAGLNPHMILEAIPIPVLALWGSAASTEPPPSRIDPSSRCSASRLDLCETQQQLPKLTNGRSSDPRTSVRSFPRPPPLGGAKGPHPHLPPKTECAKCRGFRFCNNPSGCSASFGCDSGGAGKS
jgi:hypothetical protein